MKEGDKVYVNWPTGKGGPYEIASINGTEIVIFNEKTWAVQKDYVEIADQEIEEDRLVYVRLSSGYSKYAIPYAINLKDMDPKPVNRRPNEWTKDQMDHFVWVLNEYYAGGAKPIDIANAAYRNIVEIPRS